jgi:hypothetical protein
VEEQLLCSRPDLRKIETTPFTSRYDIWALGCVTFQLFAESTLFVEVSGPLHYYVVDHLSVGHQRRSKRVSGCNLQNGGGKITEDRTDHCEPMWDEPFDYLRV